MGLTAKKSNHRRRQRADTVWRLGSGAWWLAVTGFIWAVVFANMAELNLAPWWQWVFIALAILGFILHRLAEKLWVRAADSVRGGVPTPHIPERWNE